MDEHSNPNPTGAYAAGIMLVTSDGETLLLRRGDGGDFPGTWAFPAGKIEVGESPQDAALREFFEKTGIALKGGLERLHETEGFVTFIAKGVAKFEVEICGESTGYAWCRPEEAPAPLHPGIDRCFRIAAAHTETDLAKLIRDGDLPSPQAFGNSVYFALRITGTGIAFRKEREGEDGKKIEAEYAWRDESIVLTPEFLERCNGLPVVWLHPEKSMLDTKSYRESNVGTIVMPYINGSDAWGIARILDMPAAKEMTELQLSTSPGFVFVKSSGNVKVPLNDTAPLLIEGNPVLLDHLAVCELGVWDKGGPPMGVQLKEVQSMPDQVAATGNDPAGTSLSTVMEAIAAMSSGFAARLDSVTSRFDALEKNMPAPTLAGDSKKDAEEKEAEAKKDAEEKEEKAKLDAKKDADEKAEAEAKKDAFEKEEQAKKDAAMKCDADPEVMADAQAKADSVYQMHSMSASRPMDGETPMAYRVRLLRKMQPHSKTWAKSDLSAIKDSVAFDMAEAAIYADAAAASNLIGQPSGDGLRAIRRIDPDTGHNVTTYAGRPGAWCEEFKAPAQLAQGGFHRKQKESI